MINYNFKNKNFVLTGGGKGIGKATLEKLHISGARIAVITRSSSDINLIKKKYKNKRLIVFHGDVTKETDINFFFAVFQDLTNIDLFLVSKDIEESLAGKETGKCLAWCHENKSKLRKMKVSNCN